MKEMSFSVSHSSSRLWPGFSGTKFNLGCVTRYFIHSHVCGWVADEERSEGCQSNACQWYCQEEGPSLLDFKGPKPKKDTPVQKLSILHCLFISFLRKTNYWKVFINTPGPPSTSLWMYQLQMIYTQRIFQKQYYYHITRLLYVQW